MSHESEELSLIPLNQNPFLSNCYRSIPLIYDSVDEHLFSLVGTTGAIQGLCSTYGVIIKCNSPDDTECIATVQRNAFYIALGMSYGKILIKIMKLFCKSHNIYPDCFNKFDKIVDTLIALLGVHTFYLLCGASIAAAAAHSNNIANSIFWAAIALPTVALAFFSNADIRYSIREQCCGYFSQDHASRGVTIKICDSIASFLEGSASLIGAISPIEQIHDNIHNLSPNSPDSWISSKGGMIGRYCIGIIYGLIQCWMRWHNSPMIKEEKILKSRCPSVMQSILNAVTFFILTGFAISQNQKSDRISMAALFGLLVIGGLACALFNIIRNWAKPNEQNVIGIIDDSYSQQGKNIQYVENNGLRSENNLPTSSFYIESGSDEMPDMDVNGKIDLEETHSINTRFNIQPLHDWKNFNTKEITRDITKKVMTFFKLESEVKSKKIIENSAQTAVEPIWQAQH